MDTLIFEAFERGWEGETDFACFIITRGDRDQWSALATESIPGTMYGGRSWTIDAATSDGAMLACRRAAAAESFEGWELADDPDHNAARCYDCSGPCRRGSDLCEGCAAPVEPDAAAVDAVSDEDEDLRYCRACTNVIDTHGERQRGMCVGCTDDSAVCRDWRLAVVDEDGAVTWTGSGWDYVQENPHDLTAVLRLRVGLSFDRGGGAAPWYAVVRLPNVE